MTLKFGMALALSLLSGGANAQDLHVSSPENCELHFWGSEKAKTTNYSGVGGLAGALLSGPRPQTQGELSADLTNSDQLNAIRKLDLASLFKVPSIHLIAEEGPIRSKPGKPSRRLTNSTAPCYFELVVDFIGYSSHITAGRKFGARLWLRNYDADTSSLAKVQNGGEDVKVRLYPAKKDEDRDLALQELHTAFSQTVSKFLSKRIH